MVQLNENIVGIDAAIFMHPTTWKASGHVEAFNDPLIDNKDSKKRYRADVLIEEFVSKIENKISREVTKAAKRFGNALIKLNTCLPIHVYWSISQKLIVSLNAWQNHWKKKIWPISKH